MPVPDAQSLDRCAVVGSGHSLRCGSPWGGTIDSYDAVFRVNNRVQLQTENRNGIRLQCRQSRGLCDQRADRGPI